MFTRESLLTSEWYAERLTVKQRRDVALWDEAHRLGIPRRLEHAGADRVGSPECLRTLVGTIGADPVHRPAHGRPGSAKAARGGVAVVGS